MSTASPVPDPGYAFYRAITVPASNVPSDQSGFPILVTITDSSLRSLANGGHVTSINDLAFASDIAGTSLLNWEIEKYDTTTGSLVAHVQVNLSHTSGGTFYMVYGKPFVDAQQNTPVQTWDSNFVGVWHLGDGTSASGVDSTSYVNSASSVYGSAGTSGLVYGAALLNGSSNYLRIPSAASLQGFTQLTVCADVNAASFAGDPTLAALPVNDSSVTDPYQLWDLGLSSNSVFFAVSTGSSGSRKSVVSTETVGTSAWHRVCGVYTGTTLYTYIDGVRGSNTTAATLTVGTNTLDVRLGAFSAWVFAGLAGKLDEIRISKTARTQDWITMEYNSLSSPWTFAPVGAEVAR
jgi:hypothetical protein